ncbi:hypothetical protein ACDA63_18770 [Uliginosibacterium sp. sgz301328]|uniref:hypothetical protein n=1 Tax=Uliginosibacterium sp. sgz301328 TaxID=3243764 RepID=UPI00359DCC80
MSLDNDHAIRKSLPWYRTSFVFVLLGLQTFAAGMPLLGLIAMLLAAVNLKNDDWYRHRWPWFVLLLLLSAAVAALATVVIANANPDTTVPTYQLYITQYYANGI